MTKPKVYKPSEHTDRALLELERARFKLNGIWIHGFNEMIPEKADRTLHVMMGSLTRMKEALKDAGY